MSEQNESSHEYLPVEPPQEEDTIGYSPTFKQKSALLNGVKAVFLGLGGIYFGYYISIMNVMGEPIANNILNITDKTERGNVIGNLNFLYSIAAAFSALFTGLITKHLGRIRTLLAMEVLMIVAGLLYSQKNVYFLYVARVISGASVSLNQAVGSITMVELLPPSISGGGNVFIYFCITISILASNLIPLGFTDNQTLADYHILILSGPLIITLIRLPVLLLLFWDIESPNYYFEKNLSPESLKEKLTQICKTLYEASDVEQAAEYLQQTDEKRKLHETEVTFLSLLNKKYIFRFSVAILLNIAQQMSGINFIVQYCTTLFDEINGTGKTTSIIMAAANVAGAFAGIYMVERFGRKKNMLGGSVAQMLAFYAIGTAIYMKWYIIMKFAIVAYMFGFAVGLGGVTTLFSSEIVPAVGVGVATSAQWFFAALVGS